MIGVVLGIIITTNNMEDNGLDRGTQFDYLIII
jgi:hypothetical protein